MTKAQEEVAMGLLGLTEPPALVRIHLTDGPGRADLYDISDVLLGTVLLDVDGIDGNVSLGS